MIDNRIYAVLNAIVREPLITSGELCKKFELTRKQLSYTLHKLNDYLATKELLPVSRQRHGGFSVDSNVLSLFYSDVEYQLNERYVYSEKERHYIILFLLLCRSEKIKLFHFTQTLHVSQNTILNDIKKVNSITDRYDVQVVYERRQGYFIEGSEIQKRYLLLEVVTYCLSSPFFEDFTVETTKNIEQHRKVFADALTLIEREFKIFLTDEKVQQLTLYMSLVALRISAGKILHVLPEHIHEVCRTREFLIIGDILNKAGINQVSEQLFLTAIIRSANIQTISERYFNLEPLLLEGIVAVVNNFEKLCCIAFRDKDELINKIYQHWKSAYYRIIYNFTYDSGVYELIAQEFNYLHQLVIRSISPLESLLQQALPEEEVASLTVILGGWLTREGLLYKVKVKKSGVVVSSGNATVSTWIFLTLQSLLPEIYFQDTLSFREYEKYTKEHDVIFSTSLFSTHRPLLLINLPFDNGQKNTLRCQTLSLLGYQDNDSVQVENVLAIVERFGSIQQRKDLRTALEDYLYSHSRPVSNLVTSHPLPSLASLLQKDFITLEMDIPETWQEVIHLAASPLLKNKVIEPCYISAIINKIMNERPYIMLGEGVVIAHAGVDEGVNKIGFSLCRLPHPVLINDYIYADIIITCATHNTQGHLKALSQLNNYLEECNGAKSIRDAVDKEEIVRALQYYS
ncbi:BglG family transcription antiterminator [Escherichia whittamii]|uniref:BglG family transcription antiterminator n=1 Tax=Escherichia whittamii TaxID=2762229 RepID=UPI002E1E9A8C|nr:BglG family transcription antiterminator [Escherichia whittamii]MEC9560584.1 BglG family transcription antiterminator [Escherichia whittamii]